LLIFIGDKGYRATPILRTPVRQPATPQEREFNEAFIPKRLIAEHGFGEIKSVFRAVDTTGGYLCYQPKKCSQIIVTCAMLHNIKLL
jgi:DDE superfamily endonuclease